MTVFTYDTDARISAAKAALEGDGWEGLRIHLLPIPTKGLLGNKAACEAFLSGAREGDFVFGYGIPAALAELLRARGLLVSDVERDEAFIEENAALTAEVTMGYLLSEPRAPRDLKVGIIGYGRIGRALCRMLLFFGAKVRIFTERDYVRTGLGAAGIESRPIRYEAGAAADLTGLDILIQTAPAKIFIKGNAPPCPFWNLAAAAYVGEGVAVRQLSALPARVTYESGGRALARAVLRGIENAKTQKAKG